MYFISLIFYFQKQCYIQSTIKLVALCSVFCHEGNFKDLMSQKRKITVDQGEKIKSLTVLQHRIHKAVDKVWSVAADSVKAQKCVGSCKHQISRSCSNTGLAIEVSILTHSDCRCWKP